VSSILEALRELEGTKPSAQRSRVAWASEAAEEERTPLGRAAELLGIVAFGLALGGVGFAIVVWLGSPDAPTAPAATVATPARGPATPAPAAPALTPAAPAPPVPGWLARMGPPRGRVDGGDAAGAVPAADAPGAPRPAGLSLVSVRYGDSRGSRTATLRIDGSPVVLHEGETAYGIELQLVTPAGAYVRRGGEVLMLEPSR
jgi:hypothetical protein